MFRLYGHGLYYCYTGNNENKTIVFTYHVVDDFGGLVEVGKYTQPWRFNK